MNKTTTQNRLLAAAYDNPLIEAEGPKSNPGELANWPMLKIAYRTDKDRIAALLPPGLEPDDSALVLISFYNLPIQNSPEYGIGIGIAANYKGTAGEYTMGIGINQETVIYPSKERWGQPKFHAETQYWRLGNVVEARTIHYGHTFAEWKGEVVGQQEPLGEAEQREFWVKYMRDCDLTPGKFDFNPHFVNVYTKFKTTHLEKLEGELILRDSKWDPIATLLPKREQVSAHLWTPTFLDRKITLGDPIDPDKFWPYADTIGGSRWPGENGAPPAV